MNPGPVEEVSKATNKFIDTMAAQPLALALVFMNVCLLALFWFIFAKSSDHAKERERQMFEEQAHVRELLSKCVVPSGGTPQGQFPNLTPTNVAWFWEKKGEPFTLSAAGEVTLLKPEQERRINDLMQEAIDESLKTQIGHLFEVWMKSPGEEAAASRAGVGARNAVTAYRGAMRALEKRKRRTMSDEETR